MRTPATAGAGESKEIIMELIGKQIAIETILGQPPELHYPSWYAAQIEKLPPAPPEYLAEQAGILLTDTDMINRAKAIEALTKDKKALEHIINGMSGYEKEFDRFVGQRNQVDYDIHAIEQLPPAQPEHIIRCKDCKHWIPYDWMFREVWQSRNINDYPEDEIGCNCSDMAMKANDFCSRGERRTDG